MLIHTKMLKQTFELCTQIYLDNISNNRKCKSATKIFFPIYILILIEKHIPSSSFFHIIQGEKSIINPGFRRCQKSSSQILAKIWLDCQNVAWNLVIMYKLTGMSVGQHTFKIDKLVANWGVIFSSHTICSKQTRCLKIKNKS